MEKISGDVIARLRASRQQYERACYKHGHEIGTEWAQEAAEAEHLMRLESFRRDHETQPPYDWEWFFSGERRSGYSMDQILASKILDLGSPDREESVWFWESVIGGCWARHVDSGAFLRGFAEGALEVWAAVQRAA